MSRRILAYILGDVHADIVRLNSFIDEKIRKSPQIRVLAEDYEKGGDELRLFIFQSGDLAFYWPGYSHVGKINNRIDFLPGGHVPMYWCGGNHEDWDRLDRLFPEGSAAAARNIAQVDDCIYFCRFGATLELGGNLTVLFAGGAESIDKDHRLRKMRFDGAPKIWWEQEGISEADMARLDNVSEAQWVVSHTAPMGFNLAPFGTPEPEQTTILARCWKSCV